MQGDIIERVLMATGISLAVSYPSSPLLGLDAGTKKSLKDSEQPKRMSRRLQ